MKTPLMMEFAARLKEGVYRKTQGALHTVTKKVDGSLEHEMCFWGAAGKFTGASLTSVEPSDLTVGMTRLLKVDGVMSEPPLSVVKAFDMGTRLARFDFPVEMYTRDGKHMRAKSIVWWNDSSTLTLAQMGDLLAHFGMTDT